MKSHKGVEVAHVEINGLKKPAGMFPNASYCIGSLSYRIIVYDPIFDVTIIFDDATHLPHIIRANENHMIYGQSTNDLYMTNYKNVNGIQFPHLFQTVYNSTTQNLNAVLEDYIVDSISVNPEFSKGFFDGVSDGEGFFPKAAPKKVKGVTHAQITEFSSNGLWSGIPDSSVKDIKYKNPVPGLPNVYWVIVDDGELGVKQFVIEFDDHVIVGDAPPQWTKDVIQWIKETINKPVKYLWVSLIE